MSAQLERDVRYLKRYAIVSTLAFGILALAAFRQQAPQQPEKVKFTEIDVERINVVEPNGMYRMVLSNRPRSIGPIYKGKPFGYAGGDRKSTRLNSSHSQISYAVFCLKKKKTEK